jgi:hypothetical protein
MMWALIINGKVRELSLKDPARRFHPDLLWVVVPAGVVVEENWLYSNGEFSAPQTPLARLKQRRK